MNGFEPNAHCEGTRNRFHKIPTPSGRTPQIERHRKRRCPTAGSKARTIDTAFGHGRPPICFLSRQLESYRGGPRPPFHLDAILLSKCARNCTLPSRKDLTISTYGLRTKRVEAESVERTSIRIACVVVPHESQVVFSRFAITRTPTDKGDIPLLLFITYRDRFGACLV